MAGKRELNAISKKQLEQRDMYWPTAPQYIWDRKSNNGFATIPKTMPLIQKIMDDMSNGRPLSSTYLGLWCATWDNSFVIVSKPSELAHAAGFGGQRAEYTWAGRMKILKELEFIDYQPGKHGQITYVVIWNPHWAIRAHQQRKTPGLSLGTYNALLDRALEIGAKDMIDGLPAKTTTIVPESEDTL